MNVLDAESAPQVTVARAVPGSVSGLTHHIHVSTPLALAVFDPSPLASLVYPLGSRTERRHDASGSVVRAVSVSLLP